MLAPELTPRTARRERRREKRALLLPTEHEELFLLLAVLRAASADALHTLHFVERSPTTSLRSTYRALTALERAGFLERQRIPGSRAVYRMTARAYASSPRVRRRATEAVRRPLSEAIAGYCWLRAATWAELKKRGYRVGRDAAAQRAVRRFLVDGQRAVVAGARGATHAEANRVLAALRATPSLSPMFRGKCERCAREGPLGQPLIDRREELLGDATQITTPRVDAARASSVAEAATRTRRRRRDELTARREAERPRGASEDDLAGHDGLAQHLEGGSAELRELIEEQHAGVLRGRAKAAKRGHLKNGHRGAGCAGR